MPLVPKENRDSRVIWWINAAYGVYSDIKIHPGGMILIGNGSTQIKPSKKNLNIRSSTEDKRFGVDKPVSGIMRNMRFLEAKVYKA